MGSSVPPSRLPELVYATKADLAEHGIVNTIKADHARIQATQELFEFRDTVQVLSHLLDEKLVSMHDTVYALSKAGPSDQERGRKAGRISEIERTGKRKSSPRALSLERRQKRHKSYSTL